MKSLNRPLKFIDLFCGIGGFRVALEREGHECVFSSDIDPHARHAYQMNFGDQPAGDITQIKADDIPSHDILCGGFPCQSFSITGKMKGFDDPRGQLFFEIIRIVDHHKPKIILLENVKAILIAQKGKVIRKIKKSFHDIGYDCQWSMLCSSNYGVPQMRERVYFVCFPKKSRLNYVEPSPEPKNIYLKDVLDQKFDRNLALPRHDITWEVTDTPPLARKRYRIARFGQKRDNHVPQNSKIYHPNGYAITMLAKKTGYYYIDRVIRNLSINESKRLMGFDENHYVSEGGEGYKQLGNSVIPSMVQRVFRGIYQKEVKDEPDSNLKTDQKARSTDRCRA